MKFYDEVHITISSGKGGDGLIAGRREAKIPFGGPAGGDGGKGGSVHFVADENLTTLMHLRFKKHRKAKNGMPGRSKDQYGQAGDDIIISVPVGTLIKSADGYIIAHLTEHEQSFMAAAGGKGGAGNIHFKNSHNQYPNIALLGEPGQTKDLTLELQLLGDVALIGTPSVGKSTLINAVSNVKAKTAAYEFTTIVPNLGMVQHKDISFALVDVPGLVSGASDGKGLGNVFLRHILKARVWMIMLDASKDIPGIQEWQELLNEILTYVRDRYMGSTEFGPEIEDIVYNIYADKQSLMYEVYGVCGQEKYLLMKKAIVTLVNKYDVLDDEVWTLYKQALLEAMQEAVKNFGYDIETQAIDPSIQSLSGLTTYQVDLFLDRCISLIDRDDLTRWMQVDIQEIEQVDEDICWETTQEDIPYLLEHGYIEDKDTEFTYVWSVKQPEIAYLSYVVPWGNDEAELRYWRVLEKSGHTKWLKQAGARQGDILKIISPYEGVHDRYILRD